MESLAQESRAERIARYKAERRRELAERYGNQDEELPSKWSRREREGRGFRDSSCADKSGSEAINGGMRRNGRIPLEEKPVSTKIANGCRNNASVENIHQNRECFWGLSIALDRENPPESYGPSNPDKLKLHTRVSVGKLKNSLLHQTSKASPPDIIDGGGLGLTLDLAVPPVAEGSRRRTRRYMPGDPAGSRKTCERFRTQPITSCEIHDSHGSMDNENQDTSEMDVKTDDRAKMSVAAKMSLFKELEKTASPAVSSLLKPRSSFHERRTRRGNDNRALTQPITFEETVTAASPQSGESKPQTELEVEDDAGSKLSMSEKLALFNKLSQPILSAVGSPKGDGGSLEAGERRRLKGARYRTQPITIDEVNLLQKGPVQLPHLHLSAQLSDRQQALSINLKPSEVALKSTQEPESSYELTTAPSQQPTEECSSKNALHRGTEIKGILKKSSSAGAVWRGETKDSDELNGHGPEQNEGEMREMNEERHTSVSPVDSSVASLSGAPWRQRARKDSGASSVRTRRSVPKSEGRLSLPEKMLAQAQIMKHSGSSVSDRRMESGVNEEEEDKKGVEARCNMTASSDGLQDEAVSTIDSTLQTQLWEPVFSSVYSRCNSTPQYVMCFNERSLSYEAQEVSSPSQSHVKGRVKANCEEEDSAKLVPTETQIIFPDEFTSSPQCVSEMTKEDMSSEPSSLPGCQTSGGDTEPDLSTLCQTNTPILSSAVAEHRRSVRPSRRTQGSRNPLRALAAREDIQQDFMQHEDNSQMENHSEAMKNSNCSTTDVTSCGQVSRPTVPYNKLMLIQVKGWRQVQVRLVEPLSRSLNSGDCFLLVTPSHCFLWTGKFSNTIEREKASELASLIVTQRDLGCQATGIVHLDEGVNTDSLQAAEFWKLLGGQTQYKGPDGAADDEHFEKAISESNCIYSLQGDRLRPHEQAWASIPHLTLLDSSQTLLFDFGSELYLWHGKDVGPSERKVSLQLAQQVWDGAYDYSSCRISPLDPSGCHNLKQGIGRPDWAIFGRVFHQNETVLFKEKFAKSFEQTTMSKNHISLSIQEEVKTPLLESSSPPTLVEQWSCDAKALLSGACSSNLSQVILDGVDVRSGRDLSNGRQAELRTMALKTWLVLEGEEREVDPESFGQFHEDNTYAIQWTYCLATVVDHTTDEQEKSVLFIWKGRHSRISGRDLSSSLTKQCGPHVFVKEGEELPCFLQLFQGRMVIHRQQSSRDVGGWRMFCVRGDVPVEGSLLEVEPVCSNLRSRGSLLLLNGQQGAINLWHGCKAHTQARQVAKQTVQHLKETCPPEFGLKTDSFLNVQEVEEGKEPAEFWNAIGPQDRKSYDCMLQDPGKFNFTPRLFHLSAQSGMFKGVELMSPSHVNGVVTAMPFLQDKLYDVPHAALFLLDNFLEVYLWQSSEAAASQRPHCDKEKKCAMETVLQYCRERNPRRPPMAYLIDEGVEPLTFTNIFPSWELRLTQEVQDCVGCKKLTLVQDALAALNRTQYPLKDLLRRPLPEGVDPLHLENYLSQNDFKVALGMTQNDYNSLSGSQKMDLKKSKGLY